MGIIKLEISLPEAVKAVQKFKENRLKALEVLGEEFRDSVAKTLNQLLSTEMQLFLGEKDQSDNKKNGFKERDYTLKGVGTLRLKMPQDRKSLFSSHIIPKNEVIDPRLKEDVAVLHLAGISNRTMAMISKRLLGVALSADTVSQSLNLVQGPALQWLQRPLQKKYWALYVDGTNFKIQRRGSTQSEPSLVVLGIDDNNYRSILAIEPGFKDSAQTWEAVFNSLVARGLDVSHVRLGIMDGLPGLEKCFRNFFPHSKTQRCWVHSLRNTLAKTPERLREPFKKLAHQIMYAASKDDAQRAFSNLKQTMATDAQRALACLEKDLNSLLTFYDFDKNLWPSLKTTNPIERINKELKRRTKSMGTLGEQTLEIILAFTALRIENSWTKNPMTAKQFQNLIHVKDNSIEVTLNEMFH